jgi:hypothetical protein
MAKNAISKKQHTESPFDYSDFMEPYDDNEMMSNMVGGLIEVSNQQMRLAFDLTSLIIANTQDKNGLNQEKILEIFQHASKDVSENLPIKAFWKHMS